MEGNTLSFAKRYLSTRELVPVLWRFIFLCQYSIVLQITIPWYIELRATGNLLV